MEKPKKGPVKRNTVKPKKPPVKQKKAPVKQKKEPVKKEPIKKEKVRRGVGITVIQENKENYMDNSYPEKINLIIKKIKDQNTMIDDKIRFGWNN